MSKRKPLSAEEKRTKLLELFHESGDVFQLKDLEKLAPKEKGIVLQSVKQVLVELVENGEVRAEKISGSLYYWSFPSDSHNTLQKKLQESEISIRQLDEKISAAQLKLKEVSAISTNAKEIEIIENEILQLHNENKELDQKLSAHANELDLEALAAKRQDAKRILEAANRWTDNIFSTKTWCKQKFAKEDRELDKAFGIPEDLDYLEE